MLYSKFLFHLNLERILQCIQVILDANLPFGIAPYEGLRLRILLVDWETGGEIGRSGQAVIPYGHLVEAT